MRCDACRHPGILAGEHMPKWFLPPNPAAALQVLIEHAPYLSILSS